MPICRVYMDFGQGTRRLDFRPTPGHVSTDWAMQGSVTLGAKTAFSQAVNLFTEVNLLSARWRFQQELEAIKPKCDKNIASWANNNPDRCYDLGTTLIGTIVQVVFARQNQAIGFRDLVQFWEIFEGDIGLDSNAVPTITKFLRDPSRSAGHTPVPANATAESVLFWYTYDSSPLGGFHAAH